MAVFTYKAKDLQGLEHKGEIESGDIRSALLVLRRKGLIVIGLDPKATSGGNFFDKFFHKVGFNDVVTFTRQLATMIGAGLVLSESIDILEEQQENKNFKKALGEVSHDIKGGITLAAALARHPRVFPSIYVNLVKSGEASGKLDQVLLRMADSLEKDREFRSKVKGALIYPVVVLTMMLAVIILMMVFVVPKLTALYKESTLDLPLPTKILIATSNAFVYYWWLMIIVIAVAVVVFRRWVKTPDGRLGFDRFLLKVPIVGKIITNVTLTNFNRTFGLLVSAGVPLLEAIHIVGDVIDNNVFKAALKDSYGGVERGLSFSAQLTNLPIFPRIISQMIKVGEETGKLDEIFAKLSEYFESESDNLIKNLTVAIEPIVLVILGVGVGFLALSIILPIYKLTTSF